MLTHYFRNLPHIQPVGGTFFVTFRLAESLPADVIDNYMDEREKRLSRVEQDEAATYDEQKRLFALFDDYLDRCLTPTQHLRQEAVARILMDVLHGRDKQTYDLLAYCIMPNHVHLVLDLSIQPTDSTYQQLYRILGTLKGYSARLINQHLCREGTFWQHESYDHLVRNDAELERVIGYVLQNPVKANLVNHWHEWPYSYVTEDFRDEFV